MKNSINAFNVIFSKQHKVFLDAFDIASQETEKFGKNRRLALTLQANIEPLGFSFSKEVLVSLSHLSEDKLTQVWSHLVPQAELATGSNRSFKPMYPNFPAQVINASEEELMLNALVHYAGSWLGLRVLPRYEEKARLPLLDKVEPKLIQVATMQDIEKLFFNLISANSSLSESDKANTTVLFNYLNERGTAQGLIEKANIAQKENLAFVGNLILNSTLDFNTLIAHQFTTPTDVLRLTSAMFEGDVSLAKPTKMGKMSRPMRRALMATLENQLMSTNDKSQLIENFFTYKEMWVRVGHALHPGEHAKKFPLVASVFQDLRDNNKPVTFNSQAEVLMLSKQPVDAAKFLASRPGVFARNLNRLLVMSDEVQSKAVLKSFSNCSYSIATPVLLQLHSHFLHQHEKTVRTFMPKGGLSKLFVVDNEAGAISVESAKAVTTACEVALKERFKSFPELGKVYVDPALKLQNTPFAQRSASKALASVARGSRFAVEEDKDTIRLFLWWNENGKNKEGKDYTSGRVDIDLSCVLMDKDYKQIDVCSYYNLRSEGMTHSGDFTSAPQGACEFIDIDLKKLDSNIRYVVMTISSYTQQKYCDLPECFAGWMMKDKPQSGKIFDARTVKNKVDLTSDSTQMMPAIFDTQTKEFIWADIAVKTGYGVNNVANNLSGIGYNVKAITNLIKPNLYDLFMLHAEARGQVVSSKEEADTVFSLHEGVTPYMFDRIASEFMADCAPALLEAEPVKPTVVVKKKKM